MNEIFLFFLKFMLPQKKNGKRGGKDPHHGHSDKILNKPHGSSFSGKFLLSNK